MVAALCFVWIIGAFDLLLTCNTAQCAEFYELNPLASQFIGSPPALALFKYGLLSFGTVMLVAVRHHRLAAQGAYFLAGAHGCLAVYWTVYLTIQTGWLPLH